MLVITTPVDQPAFQRLLGDGSGWGMAIRYAVQPSPDGLAQAFLIGADFLAGAPAALVLGDNLFHGHDLVPQLAASNGNGSGATVYAYPVRDPERYEVVEFAADGRVLSIEEKPAQPQGLLEVCPSKPGSLAAATVLCAGTALHPCRPSLPSLPPLAI